MKKSIKTTLMIVLFIIICSISVFSYAATNQYEVKLQSNKNKYNPGETVELVVSVEDIKMDEGIAAFSAILNYDSNVFEEIDVKEIDEWDNPILMEDMIQSTRKDLMNSKENQKVASISLKIKENVKDSEYTINLSKFDATDGNETIRNDGASIDIKIEGNHTIEEIPVEKSSNIAYIILGIVIITIVVVLVVVINKRKK